MNISEVIARINVLAKKAKTEGLTPEEIAERDKLRRIYIDSVKANLTGQLDNTYIVEGKWLERLMSNVNFGDYESRMFFDKMLREHGVFQQLEDLGIKDGDIVSMYELEFEYQH